MRFLKPVLMAGVSLSFVAPVLAQSAAPAPKADAFESLDEIVVTAQRRVENVQDVPISISVVGAEQLERMQITDVRDLTQTSASLQFQPPTGGSPGNGAVIRGIGTFGFSKGSEAAVGTVVDGVVQGNTSISNLFDIQRVEVLRGPQGTLFGQSVSAGVVNISTVAPNPDRVEGKVSVEMAGDGFAGSEFGKQIVRGALNVPVSEQSALRVSAFGTRTDGVLTNPVVGKDEIVKEGGVRARYLADFGDNVTVNLIGDYSRLKNTNGGFFTLAQASGPRASAQLATCGVVGAIDNFARCADDGPQLLKNETYGLSGQVDVDFDGLVLTSITAYRESNRDTQLDIDGFPSAVQTLGIATNLITDSDQFTQEIRLASDKDEAFSYTVGGFYQDFNTLNDQYGVTRIYFGRLGLPGPPQLNIMNRQIQDTQSSNLSGFGEVRYNMGAFTTFAGARINRAEIRQPTSRQDVTPATGPIDRSANYAPTGPLVTSDVTVKDTDVSWRFGGQYETEDNVMYYSSVSRGYKSAQISNLDPRVPAIVVNPEKPLDFQLGVKSSLLDDHLAFNINGFYTRVKDYQSTSCTLDAVTQVPVCNPFNISRVITKGVEADIFGRPTRDLSLNLNFLYNIAKYPGRFLAQDGVNMGGHQIAYAPRFKATLSGEYTMDLSETVEGFLALDGTYRSKTRMGIERGTDQFVDKARFVFGGRIGARLEDGWSISLFARNIGNEPMPTSFATLPTPQGDPATSLYGIFQSPGSRRLVGLQAEFEF